MKQSALCTAHCWVICGLLLFGTTKNYMDRNVLGVFNTTLQHDLGWTEIDYSNLVVAFHAAYAVGMLVAGRFIDRVGTRHVCAVPATAKAPLTASAAGTA